MDNTRPVESTLSLVILKVWIEALSQESYDARLIT